MRGYTIHGHVFLVMAQEHQSIFTRAQVDLLRFSDSIRYWPAIFDYHSANLSRYWQCLGIVVLST